jgi:hypothetical protein
METPAAPPTKRVPPVSAETGEYALDESPSLNGHRAAEPGADRSSSYDELVKLRRREQRMRRLGAFGVARGRA